MVRFSIRDDDTCYFTRPEHLERVYGRLQGVPVGLAVTPFAVRSDYLGDPDRFRQSGDPMPLEDNRAITDYLRRQAGVGRYSVLLHGHTHEYRRVAQLVPECVWKSPERLRGETAVGKEYLERILQSPVRVFVPPGNAVSLAGLRAIGDSVPNILSTLPLRKAGEYLAGWQSGSAWCRRCWDQFRYGGPSPFAYHLGGVRLLACTSWTAHADWEETVRRMALAKSLGADFTVAVHYWELQGGVLDGLLRLVDQAMGMGFHPAHCADLFDREIAGAEAHGNGKGDQWASFKIS